MTGHNFSWEKTGDHINGVQLSSNYNFPTRGRRASSASNMSGIYFQVDSIDLKVSGAVEQKATPLPEKLFVGR